ncbi:MAG: GntR family transcriptional regulator [Chloroflexi bacterium]|nr:GntR family transcriptional regulator [Chloroflexota bacterium]
MTLDGLDTLPPSQNTADRIAEALRKAILQGQLHSGQSLRQDEIAATFQVSKIPVREALFQLQAEGLVDIIHNRGAIVTSLNTAEIEELYTMRIALESIALRRAIPRMTTADFLTAEAILNHIDIEPNLRHWADLNWQFHEALYRPSGMFHLLDVVKTLHTNVVRYLITQRVNGSQLHTSQQEHRAILAHARDGDVSAACAALEQHLAGAVKAVSSN